MAWNTKVSEDDLIASGNHNEMIDVVEDISSSSYGHSSNTSNPHEVVWTDVSTAAKTDLADDYAPSSGYNTHINDSTIHYAKSTLDDDYYPSSLGNSLNTSYNNHSGNTNNPHEVAWSDVSTAAKTDLANDYAPSSGYHTHITNTANPHEVVWSDVSAAAITDLDDNYYPSSTGNSLKTSYTNHSGQTNKHIDHSGVDITAGDGLTGGGDLTTTRTLTVVGSTGITANAGNIVVTNYNQIVGNANSGQTANAWLDTSGSNYNTAYTHSQDNSQAHSDYLINNGINTNISGTTISGGTIKGIVPMTYSIANVRISAQQNINLAKFSCPAGKKAYIYQAYACNSSQTSVDDLLIQILSGSTNVYKTSSSTLQQGNPLAISNGGNTEIRFMYSGAGVTGIEFGSCMIQVGVY